MYNTLNSNHNNFLSEFDISGDSVLAIIRRVSLGRAQYYRLTDYPISISGNKDNEDFLFSMMFEDKQVQQAYIPELFLDRIDKTKYIIDEKPSDYNFYSDVAYDTERMNNKFKTKYRINMLLNNIEFSFSKIDIGDAQHIASLYCSWSESKEDLHNKVLFRNYFKQFSYLINLGDLLQYCIRYNGKVIALVVFSKMADGYCYKLIQWTYTRNNTPEKSEILDKILSQIGQILHYLYTIELNKIGIKYISCAGSASGNRGLISHKDEIMRNKISYYRIIPRY